MEIDDDLAKRLKYLGIIPDTNDTRSFNEGASNYSSHTIQPWSIWLDYPELSSFDHDIIKRVLRTKATDSRALDYKKIIHICEERLRQLGYYDLFNVPKPVKVDLSNENFKEKYKEYKEHSRCKQSNVSSEF